MAPSQILPKPQGTPPTPAIVAPDDNHGEPSFQFTCDDYDGDNDQAHHHDHDQDEHIIELSAANPPERKHSLSPATLLHPHHSPSLRPPALESTFAMATEGGLVDGGSNGPTPKNPFNFQTQFISSGPVKPVREHLPLLGSCNWVQLLEMGDGMLGALKTGQLTSSFWSRTLDNDEATVTNTAR